MSQFVAKSEMLIRRAVSEVFAAFVDAGTIRKFWLENVSGPLAAGAEVEWTFMAPGASTTVRVVEFREDRCIVFDWSDGIRVQLLFVSHVSDQTRAVFTASGFRTAASAVAAMEGFSIVLCDLKTLLEGGQSANLVRDKAIPIASTR